MYQTILAPVDGSDASMAAAEAAVELATAVGATIHVLYVVEKHPTYTKKGANILAQEEEQEAEWEFGEQVVAEVAEMAGDADVECSTAVQSGQPAFVITDRATSLGVDVIVIGSGGRSGLTERILGSTAERVFRQSPVSVLGVR